MVEPVVTAVGNETPVASNAGTPVNPMSPTILLETAKVEALIESAIKARLSDLISFFILLDLFSVNCFRYRPNSYLCANSDEYCFMRM